LKDLRKKLRSLRFLIWFALAFAIFAYVVKPLKNALWDDAGTSTELCRGARAGGELRDRQGHLYKWATPGRTLVWVGADGVEGTADDVHVECDAQGK